MKLLKTINPENVIEVEVEKFNIRESVRCIVKNENNEIGLLQVTKENYFKLPGGGVDDDKDLILALKRECLEELGCSIEVQGEIGEIIEWRKFCNLKQISYCYFGEKMGRSKAPNFTKSEIDEGFAIRWVSLNEALELLKTCKPYNLEGQKYIVPRDILILETYLDLISSKK